jgi:hypothetical protein
MYHSDMPLGRFGASARAAADLHFSSVEAACSASLPFLRRCRSAPRRGACHVRAPSSGRLIAPAAQQRRAGSCSGVGGEPRDQDGRLAPALAVDLAALGQDHATPRVAAVPDHGRPGGTSTARRSAPRRRSETCSARRRGSSRVRRQSKSVMRAPVSVGAGRSGRVGRVLGGSAGLDRRGVAVVRLAGGVDRQPVGCL